MVLVRLHSGPPPHGSMKGSAWRLPLRITCPSWIAIVSPGPATMRLMKFTSAFCDVAFGQGCRGSWGTAHCSSLSAPVGGWKTVTSPTAGFPKLLPMRLTSTRWPTERVGTIDGEGMR